MSAALSEAALDRVWPACTGPSAQVPLFGDGKVIVNPIIVPAVWALSACYEEFGYRTRRADTGAYVCRDKVGQPGHKSKHARKIAIDTNWRDNPFGPHLVTDRPPAMNRAIAALRTNSGAPVWTWGGDWSGNKDAMHNQIATAPQDLATGIDPRTLPSRAASSQPAPTSVPGDPNADLRLTLFYVKQIRLGAGLENPPSAVKLLQVGLNHLTGRNLAVNGVWDVWTAQTVIDVQRITGRNELGFVGPQTWAIVYP